MDKNKYVDAIVRDLRRETNPTEYSLTLIRARLNKANEDELERTYEAFKRFGVQKTF